MPLAIVPSSTDSSKTSAMSEGLKIHSSSLSRFHNFTWPFEKLEKELNRPNYKTKVKEKQRKWRPI